MKYAIKLGNHYMQERFGDDCFTDDLGHAILFETRELAENQLIGKERVVEIQEDEEGGLWEEVTA
ncbi:hypothetical protein D3C76_221980 [compost metagenome]